MKLLQTGNEWNAVYRGDYFPDFIEVSVEFHPRWFECLDFHFSAVGVNVVLEWQTQSD